MMNPLKLEKETQMNNYVIILDRDLHNSPTCQIIASAATREELRKIVIYDPLGGYETIFKKTYGIELVESHTLFSQQNGQPMPAHICSIKD